MNLEKRLTGQLPARGSQTDISDGPRFCQTEYGMNFILIGFKSTGCNSRYNVPLQFRC